MNEEFNNIDGQTINEPPKKKSKLGIIIICLVLVCGIGCGGWYFLDNNQKKENKGENTNNVTTSTETTTTTTTTTKTTEVIKEGKKLHYYGSKLGFTDYYEEEPKDKELAITITCKYAECTPDTTQIVGTIGEIYVHDGNYISVFDYDGNVLAYDIGKGVLDNLKNYSAILLSVQIDDYYLADTVFLVTNYEEKSFFIYNVTKDRYSKLYKNIDFSYEEEPEDDFSYACSEATPFGYFAFYDPENKEYIIFDINNNRELDFKPKTLEGLDMDQDEKNNKTEYYIRYNKNSKYIIGNN